MKSKILSVAAILTFSAGVSPAYSQLNGFVYNSGTGVYTTLNDPLGTSTLAFGINDLGQVVGAYNSIPNPGPRCCGNYQSGFMYSNGTYTNISVPGSTYTAAFGINDRGQIVGDYGTATGSYGFLYSNGTYTTLSNSAVPNGANSLPESEDQFEGRQW